MRPDWITDSMLQYLDQFSTRQAGELFAYWMKTLGDRLGIEKDISHHKRKKALEAEEFKKIELYRKRNIIHSLKKQIEDLENSIERRPE